MRGLAAFFCGMVLCAGLFAVESRAEGKWITPEICESKKKWLANKTLYGIEMRNYVSMMVGRAVCDATHDGKNASIRSNEAPLIRARIVEKLVECSKHDRCRCEAGANSTIQKTKCWGGGSKRELSRQEAILILSKEGLDGFYNMYKKESLYFASDFVLPDELRPDGGCYRRTYAEIEKAHPRPADNKDAYNPDVFISDARRKVCADDMERNVGMTFDRFDQSARYIYQYKDPAYKQEFVGEPAAPEETSAAPPSTTSGSAGTGPKPQVVPASGGM